MEEHERPKEIFITFNQNVLKSENGVREKAEDSQDAQAIDSQGRKLLEEGMEKWGELGGMKDSKKQMEATEGSLKKAFAEVRQEIKGNGSESQKVSRESLEKAFVEANQESAEPRSEAIRKSEESREFEEFLENNQNFEAGEAVNDFNREDHEKLEQQRSKIREALETIKKPYLELSEEERLLKENIEKTLRDYSELKDHTNLTENQREFMRLLEEEYPKFYELKDSKSEIERFNPKSELCIKEYKAKNEIEDIITEIGNDSVEAKEETKNWDGKHWDDEADLALQEIFMDEQEMKELQLELNPLEETELQPTESDESNKQRLIDPQFLELTKDYRQQTGAQKINHGLKIQKKFRNWIRSNPTLETSEKKRILEYCDDYEALIKKAIMGQVLFSDQSLEKISKDINKKFEMLTSTIAVTSFIKEVLR